MARFYCPLPLVSGQVVDLPPTAARHVQVLRMQPGHTLTLFNGEGGEFSAEVQHMGRSDVRVVVGEHRDVECEAVSQVHLAVGMPANERMDWLVEKATELGVHRITPLMTERSVVRLTGERAEKKQAHWQAVAASASEQCGRNRVPVIDMPERLDAWLARQTPQADVVHGVLSLHASTQPLNALRGGAAASAKSWVLLNGPEGGLTECRRCRSSRQRVQGLEPGRACVACRNSGLGCAGAVDLGLKVAKQASAKTAKPTALAGFAWGWMVSVYERSSLNTAVPAIRFGHVSTRWPFCKPNESVTCRPFFSASTSKSLNVPTRMLGVSYHW